MDILKRKTGEKSTEYKICVLGDDGVGKTSLIRRFVADKFEEGFSEEKQISKKEELYVSVVENGLPHSDLITLNVWDWISNITQTQSYINSKGALLICDMTNKSSLRSLEYWKNELNKVAGEVPVIIVGNKFDLKKEMELSKEDLVKYVKKLKASYMGTSAKTGKNVNNAFYKLAKMLI